MTSFRLKFHTVTTHRTLTIILIIIITTLITDNKGLQYNQTSLGQLMYKNYMEEKSGNGQKGKFQFLLKDSSVVSRADVDRKTVPRVESCHTESSLNELS